MNACGEVKYQRAKIGLATPAQFDAEEFWADLLAFIEDRRVIPVVGAELLTIELDGTSVPLYRAVAERLLKSYGFSAATSSTDGVFLREHHELNDAVCALAAAGRRVRDLYRPVHDILGSLLSGKEGTPPSLRELASIRHFDLFVTATPDGLLARAINTERFGGTAQTDEIEYAPKLPTDRRHDIPAVPSSNYAAVFYLFGKSDVGPFYAIHDEDALEFPYMLQAGGGPERMFSQLRSSNLLLIGCTFADWLSRFFLRLSNSERLFSDQRTKKEFLVGDETARDRNFTAFVERFSQDTRCYSIEARAFVTELSRRWHDRNPATDKVEVPSPAPSGNTIFLSYSSSDIGAAKQLYEELKRVGGDVAWFDRTALKPGDEWPEQISAAIKRCSLFVPLLSANTERLNESYFQRECNQAQSRAEGIRGRKFILPIVIDAGYTGNASGYSLVPEAFKALQYGHAPGGHMSDELKSEVQEQLRNLRRPRAI
jgi:hypothetical protein